MNAKRYCAVAFGLALIACVDELPIVADPRWVAVESTPFTTNFWAVATTGEVPIVSPVARRARFRVLGAATIGTVLVGRR